MSIYKICFLFFPPLYNSLWVLLGPAWCKLFSAVFITLSALQVSDVIHIHPQERYKMYVQMVQVSVMFLHSVFKKIFLDLLNIVHIIWHCLLLHYSAITCAICMYILYSSWGWMCITSETCRANSVIKTALNNLHQAGPNKTHTCLWRFIEAAMWFWCEARIAVSSA